MKPDVKVFIFQAVDLFLHQCSPEAGLIIILLECHFLTSA